MTSVTSSPSLVDIQPQSRSGSDRRNLRQSVLNKLSRKPSNNSQLNPYDPNRGIGTRPLNEPSGLELSAGIGLGRRSSPSDCGSDSTIDDIQDLHLNDSFHVPQSPTVSDLEQSKLTSPPSPTQSRHGPRSALSSIKGVLAKRVHTSKSSVSVCSSSDDKPNSTLPITGIIQASQPTGGEILKPYPHRSRLGLRRKSKIDTVVSPEQDSFDDRVVGICSVEVNRASGLPYWKAVTRIGFDMDPFVIISFGQNIFRTRVIRHSMDPVWDEKVFFHVRQHEMAYTLLFNVFDWDKMSSNDYVGQAKILISDIHADTQLNMKLDPNTCLYELDAHGKLVGDELTSYELPIVLNQSSHSKSPKDNVTGEDQAADTIFNGKLSIKAKFIPYCAMRQVFWRKYLEQFDTDLSGTISNLELTSMLDSLGSTLTRETIADFFARYGKPADEDSSVLSFEEVISCLESQLLKSHDQKRRIDVADEQIGVGQAASRKAGILIEDDSDESFNEEQQQSLVSMDFVGHNTVNVERADPESDVSLGSENDPISLQTEEVSQLDHLHTQNQAHLKVERVVNISRCPICHKQRIGSQTEINLVTHMAVCASQDWSTLDNILAPGNFVTSSQANRKWFTKVIGKVQNGRYSLGADSANIIVQDRRTGQLVEEKMQAYVRLGIRLMYKSGGSTDRMQTHRMKKLLRSLTIKQGVKYNSPESAKEIVPFVEFHRLDLDEVLLPLDQFMTFNEFFYRELKPNSRPIDSSHDPSVLTSCADCRLMVFEDVHRSRSIWIKARTFSLEKLLGQAGRKETEELHQETKWALGIFRLAPQDYHRFHAPVDGVVEDMEVIEGQYYTVNPMAIRSTVDVYGENVRVVVRLKTKMFGMMYCVFVGAMMVGSVQMNISVGDQIKKGDDIGYFAFGGSTILTIVRNEKVEWDEDLKTNSSRSIETLVRVGNRVGVCEKKALI